MLQQTQVDRVIPYYRVFLKKFPTVCALAEAPLGDVLRLWQGLGYNRRAKMLHNAAKDIVLQYGGKFPVVYSELVELPGVGEYTAKAVRVFAFNEPEVMIETNIRAVFLHHFFPRTKSVPDKKLLPLIKASVQSLGFAQKGGIGIREWYAALMDYGAYLKKTALNPSRKSAHHAKQKPFKGSDREIRGAILRAVAEKPHTIIALKKLPFDNVRIKKQLEALIHEGMLKRTRQFFILP